MNSPVKTIRKKLKLTQVELAQLSGVHPMTVSKWERGLTEPSRFQMLFIRLASDNPEACDLINKAFDGGRPPAAVMFERITDLNTEVIRLRGEIERYAQDNGQCREKAQHDEIFDLKGCLDEAHSQL